MQRVIVTVKREDEARVRDLEVPAELHAEQLARLIAEALRWQKNSAGGSVSYRIEAQPLGRTMQPDETLAGAGVWDGSWLVLHPVEIVAPTPTPAPAISHQLSAISPPVTTPVAPRLEATHATTPIQPAVAWNTPLVSESGASAPNAPVTHNASDMPTIQPAPPTVTGWRSLGLDLPPSQPAPQPQAQAPQPQPQPPQQLQPSQPQEAPVEKKSSSFVWKQLDE